MSPNAPKAPEGGIFSILGGRYNEKENYDIFLKGHAGDFWSCPVNNQIRAGDSDTFKIYEAHYEIQKNLSSQIANASPLLLKPLHTY